MNWQPGRHIEADDTDYLCPTCGNRCDTLIIGADWLLSGCCESVVDEPDPDPGIGFPVDPFYLTNFYDVTKERP